MKDNKSTLILALAAISSAACANMYIDPIEDMRAQNQKNLSQLSAGMSRQEVRQIMGTDTAGGMLGPLLHTRISNPYRIEKITGADRQEYEVLFYYTDVKRRDDVVTDDELTPVVLHNGKVVGWGYDFLGARVPRYSGAR